MGWTRDFRIWFTIRTGNSDAEIYCLVLQCSSCIEFSQQNLAFDPVRPSGKNLSRLICCRILSTFVAFRFTNWQAFFGLDVTISRMLCSQLSFVRY